MFTDKVGMNLTAEDCTALPAEVVTLQTCLQASRAGFMAVDGVETNCLEALGGTCDADYECTYVAPAAADDTSTAPSQQSGATVASLAASTLAALAAANL